MNEQAAKLTQWLLSGGAMKNIAALLTESFTPNAVAAATVDATAITAYPVDLEATLIGDHWSPIAQG